MTAITTQLSFYSPVQCLSPSIDTSNYTTDNQNSTELSHLQLLIHNKEELCDLNIDVNAKGDDPPTHTSSVSATVCDGMSYGFIVNENSIVSGMDMKQNNLLIQADKQGEAIILYPASKEKEPGETGATDGLVDIQDSEKSIKDTCTLQLDSSPNYTYTIDAEKMVSSLCNSSSTKEEPVTLQSEKTVNRKHCIILQNTGKCVSLHSKCHCNKPEGFLEKSDDADSFEVPDTSNTIPSASLVFSSPDNFVQENYEIAKKCTSPILSDSGCAEEASSLGRGSKCESLMSDHSGNILHAPSQCDNVCLNENKQKISVSCQTEQNEMCNELQYTEKIVKLSEEILQTLTSIPPSATVQSIAEICLSMKNCAQENNVNGTISENVMNNLVLSFLHVASSWMFLSSCNGLKSIVHLCHPPLNIIFKKWEANSLTLLDYMINFISETRRSVASTGTWNKQIFNSVIKQSERNSDMVNMMHQSNYLSQNPTDFSSTTPINLSTEGRKLLNEELNLHNNFLFDCSGTVSGNTDSGLASETQRHDTFKSDLLNPFNSEEQKETNLRAPTFNQPQPQFSNISQNKTAHPLNPGTLDFNKNVDLNLQGLLTNKEQLEKNNFNLHNEMTSNPDNKSLKFQTVNNPIKNFRNLNQQTLESYLQMERQQSVSDDMIGMLHTSTESLNETEQNYFATDTAEGSSLWIKSTNQQPIVLHGNTAHFPHNSNSYFLDVHFPQTNDMYNASFLPITKKLTNNRKKYHRFRFTTVGNAKSTSYSRNYNFKKSNVRGNKSKTIPFRMPVDSDSSDENNEAVYMKPGSYVVPMKHVEDLRDFIPNYSVSQVIAPKNESNTVSNRENSNNDRMWKTACASAAVFLQMVQEKNSFESSCKNQNFSSDLKENGEKQKVQRSSEVSETDVSRSLCISSSIDERNDLKIKTENHSDVQTQESCTVCSDSNMENSQTTVHSAGSTFSEPATEIKSQDVKTECDETIPVDSQETEPHRQSVSTSHGGIPQMLKDSRDHKVSRKAFCKQGTPQYNNKTQCYKQHGLNHDEITKLKSILNCIWNMEGSDIIKYPYTTGKGSENEKSSDGVIGLQTVAYKLQNHLYASIDQFVYDFHKIFHNSKDNNKEDHQCSEVSSMLCKRFDNLIEEQFSGLNFKFLSGSYSQNISCTRNSFLDHHKKHNKKNSFKVSSPKKSDAQNIDTTVK